MDRKYHIANLGIGDLIFFCGEILFNHKNGDTIKIYLSKDILNIYKGNYSHQYELFCMQYIKYFLSEYDVVFLSNKNETNYDIILSIEEFFKKILSNDSVVSNIKQKLQIKPIEYNDYIVIFTKIRGLSIDVYNSISNHFFEYINKLDKKIILLGEKNLVFGYEYNQIGHSNIYTIYEDCINKINNKNLIDLTNSTYEKYDLNNILNDINIISKSNQTFIFGGGGFFCLSLFTEKLISLVSNNVGSFLHTKNNKNIFDDKNQFINFISKL
jgi:hypothetical protein